MTFQLFQQLSKEFIRDFKKDFIWMFFRALLKAKITLEQGNG